MGGERGARGTTDRGRTGTDLDRDTKSDIERMRGSKPADAGIAWSEVVNPEDV